MKRRSYPAAELKPGVWYLGGEAEVSFTLTKERLTASRLLHNDTTEEWEVEVSDLPAHIEEGLTDELVKRINNNEDS